jgi:hypothetical protein
LYGRVILDILYFLRQLFFENFDIVLETLFGLCFVLFSLRFVLFSLRFNLSRRLSFVLCYIGAFLITSRAAGLIGSFFAYAADPRTGCSSNAIWRFKELCSSEMDLFF